MRVIARILPALLLAPPLLFAAEPTHTDAVAEPQLPSHADAYRKLRLGASPVQIWTAVIHEGYGVVGDIKRRL